MCINLILCLFNTVQVRKLQFYAAVVLIQTHVDATSGRQKAFHVSNSASQPALGDDNVDCRARIFVKSFVSNDDSRHGGKFFLPDAVETCNLEVDCCSETLLVRLIA